jgi:serine/threonine protein kinase
MPPLFRAIREVISEDELAHRPLYLFNKLFEEQIFPFWCKGGEAGPWKKWSKGEMIPGKPLARYFDFCRTVHLFDSNKLVFQIKKLPHGGRARVRFVVLIEANEDGEFKVASKAEKKPLKRKSTPEIIAMWRQEYDLLKTFVHEHIFSPREIVCDKGGKISFLEPYVALDFFKYIEKVAQGSSLDKIKNIFTILIQVAAGIEYLNDRNLVHRDIKLDNILVEERAACPPVAKIIDCEMIENVEALRERVEAEWEKRKADASAFLDEPVYLEKRAEISPYFYEPRRVEYEDKIRSKGLDIPIGKVLHVAGYLASWEKWLADNIAISGTRGRPGYDGTVPPEAKLYYRIEKAGDIFAFGTMMQEIVSIGKTSIFRYLKPAQRSLYAQLVRDLTKHEYWQRPAWVETKARLEELIALF